MKKTLSLLLVLAMVLSSFSFAFAAEAEKTPGEILKDLGVLTGNAKGDLMLEDELSRQDMIVLLSRVLGQEDEAKAFKGEISFTDVNDSFYKPYIAWAEANELTNGVGEGKFGFGRPVTEQEVATLMLRALGYNDVEFKDVPAKAAELKLVDAKADLTVNCKRARMAEITLAALGTKMNGSDKTLAEKLGIELPKPAVPEKLELVSVKADNCVEVKVEFNKEVDPVTAEDETNYTVYGKTVEAATVSEDGKTVTLSLATAAPMTNQEEYMLTFNNVRSLDKTEIVSAFKHKFTPIDAELPHVVGIEALGNKTVKLIFNEPVRRPNMSSFLIDGKTVLGYSEVVGNVVMVRFYSPLSNGEHKLIVKGVEDYSAGITGLKSLSQELNFAVVEDTTPPMIQEVVKATFEQVVLKFSEPIDPSTVKGVNVYWLQGTTKKTAAYNVIQIADDTFVFDFTGNKIQYTTDLYVKGIKDYSGNEIAADSKITVTPVLDTTRPEVVNAELDDLNTIVVKFNKVLETVSAQKSSNYVIKDANNKEVNKLKTAVLSADGKTVTVTLVQALDEGETYTLEISGISDNTTLKNVMLPYSKALETSDETSPEVVGAYRNIDNGANTIVVTFDEPMDVSGDGSIVDSSKYMYQINGAWKSLPSSALLNVSADGKSVLITFPKSISVNDITYVRVQLVKDLAGNYLKGLTKDQPVAAATNPKVVDVTAKSSTTILVSFDRPLQANTINASDFQVINDDGIELNIVNAQQYHPAYADKVLLTLADTTKLSTDANYLDKSVKVIVKTNATTSTAEGKIIVNGTTGTEVVKDGIKAVVLDVNGSIDGKSMVITFSENLKATDSTFNIVTNVATDLVIKNASGTLKPGIDYTVRPLTGSDAKLIIDFTNTQNVVSVAIVNPRFLVDANDVVVAALEEMDAVVDTAAPTATITFDTTTKTKITVKFSEKVNKQEAETLDNYVFTPKTADSDQKIVTASLDDDGTTLTITLAKDSNTGDILKIKGNVIHDLVGKALAETTLTKNE